MATLGAASFGQLNAAGAFFQPNGLGQQGNLLFGDSVVDRELEDFPMAPFNEDMVAKVQEALPDNIQELPDKASAKMGLGQPAPSKWDGLVGGLTEKPRIRKKGAGAERPISSRDGSNRASPWLFLSASAQNLPGARHLLFDAHRIPLLIPDVQGAYDIAGRSAGGILPGFGFTIEGLVAPLNRSAGGILHGPLKQARLARIFGNTVAKKPQTWTAVTGR